MLRTVPFQSPGRLGAGARSESAWGEACEHFTLAKISAATNYDSLLLHLNELMFFEAPDQMLQRNRSSAAMMNMGRRPNFTANGLMKIMMTPRAITKSPTPTD